MPRVQALFERMSEARKAISALQEAGFKGAHLDIIDRFGDEFSTEINAAGTGRGPSLSALVLNSKGYLYDVGKAPLIAASPMVSGFGSFQEIADSGTRLAVNVDDARMDEVKAIISSHGGAL